MAWVGLVIAVKWLRIGLQQSGVVTPLSLLISSDSERRMCRTSLMRRVALLLAWLSTLVSAHSIGWGCDQACSALADFSISPRLVAALCFLMRVSRLSLQLSPLCRTPAARDLVHQRVFVLYLHQLSADGGCRSEDFLGVVLSAYLSHVLTQCCHLGNERHCLGSSVGSFTAWGLLAIFMNASGYPFSFRTSLRWCSSACVFSPWVMVCAVF